MFFTDDASEDTQQPGTSSQLMSVDEVVTNENTHKEEPPKNRKRFSDTVDKFELLEKKKVKCLVCNKIYFNKDSFNNHYNNIHRENKIPTANKPLEGVQCDKCQKKYASKQNLKSHKCVSIAGVFCSQCKKKYSNKTTLKNHILAVHEGKGIKCQICDKKFTTVGTRDLHAKKFHK